MRRLLVTSIIASSFFIGSSALADEAAVLPAAQCTLGPHPGIEDVDAQTTADVVCHELAQKGQGGAREVRMGKLGGRVLLVVGDQRVMMSSLEEVPTAAQRIASASAEGKTVEETPHVDQVVGAETRAPKVKPGQMGFKGGVIGAMAFTGDTGAAPGLALGLLYRANRWGLDGHLRAGGGGGTKTTLTHVVLGTGPQYYFSDGDFSPYIGAGVGLMHFKLDREESNQSVSNTGFGGYVEGGIEALRSHHAAIIVSLRMDVPAFELAGESRSTSTYTPAGGHQTTRAPTPSSTYVAPVSLMVGMIFH